MFMESWILRVSCKSTWRKFKGSKFILISIFFQKIIPQTFNNYTYFYLYCQTSLIINYAREMWKCLDAKKFNHFTESIQGSSLWKKKLTDDQIHTQCKQKDLKCWKPCENLAYTLFNPFKTNNIYHRYQLEQSISVLRDVGWYFSFSINF